MKYSITVKFIAIILCACSLVTAAFSGIGIAFMEGNDLYRESLENKQAEQMDRVGNTVANHHAQLYAVSTLSNVPEEMLYSVGYDYSYVYQYGGYLVDIYEDGELVSSEAVNFDENLERRDCYVHMQMVRALYPVVTGTYYVGENGHLEETQPEPMPEENTVAPTDSPEESTQEATAEATDESAETTAAPTESVAVAREAATVDAALARVAGQKAVYSEEYRDGSYYDEEADQYYERVYTLDYYEGPEYEVRVYFAQDAMIGADFMLVAALYPYRDYYIPLVLAGLMVFIVSAVFLCTVAGRTKTGEIRVAAINRIPLDLYGVCMAGLVVLLCLPVVWLFESAYYNNTAGIWRNPQLCLMICCLCGLGMALCIIGFFYAFAAQVKASNNYWLRHTVVGWCLRQVGKVLGWIGKGICLVGKAFGTAGRGIRAVFLILPTIWQWLLTAFLMVACTAFMLLFAMIAWHGFWVFLWTFLFIGCVLADIAIVCYGGWCFGTLLKGIQTMSGGDLNYKIDTRFLYGSFREFGEQLNSLAEAAKLAAERQTRSERMKTELITNVSHDIKTPLTSIINFVDLMKKPHTEAEGEEYLAVLDRQSQRLKKLIDDLMDMSKASSGNISLELSKIDAAEAVNQALGEFADKLAKARLTPVFRQPEANVMLVADGKLLWRILSNVLGNAVKYAMPDTRLYVDLMVLQGNAVIAVKNISREQLNVNAEELMERFVRGDASRNTEGSGLGLNIARSLAELQGGQMHLTVDGDLFKVTLMFPLA